MSTTGGTCEYVLDPDDPATWGGRPGERCYLDSDVLNDAGVWTCPHDAITGTDRCLFHLPVAEKEAEDVVAAFREALDTAATTTDADERARLLQFVGARFGTFSLQNYSFADVPAETGIDLSYATIESSFDWAGATFDVDVLYFIGTRFEGTATFEDATFDAYVAFLAADFGATTTFEGATFGDEGDFRSASFGDSLTFESATFEDRADFSSVTFQGDADFSAIQVAGDTLFARAECRTDFTLASATIRGDVDLMGMTVAGEVDGHSLLVEGETNLQFAEFGDVGRSGIR